MNVSKTLDGSAADKLVSRGLRFLSESFGGATVLTARGSWVAQDGKVIIEQLTIVYAFTPRLTRAKLRTVKQFALTLKAELGQEAVALEINDKLFFV